MLVPDKILNPFCNLLVKMDHINFVLFFSLNYAYSGLELSLRKLLVEAKVHKVQLLFSSSDAPTKVARIGPIL